MKHPNHFGRWLACVLLCLLLAGCSMPGEQVQVEELLRAPKLSGDYGDVQTALNDWLGESAQLKYPMQGDLLSPFLLQDLDGDGRQDAAVLYTTAQSSNVCIAILQKDDADIWHVRQNVEGLADTVESVGLAQLQPGDATQLVVGYTAAQGDQYLAVYSYTDGVLSTILEQQYQQYLVEDITGDADHFLYIKPWTQFFDLKDRKDIPVSYSNHVTMRNIDFKCDNFFSVEKSDQYQLTNFTFENLNIKAKNGECDKEMIDNFIWKKVSINNIK